ncbi:MAG: AAA family ATPase [Halorhodospira sp.]
MRIERLTLQHFRGIRSLELPLGRTTVLVGANGAGKSAVLEALAILAAQLVWRIRGQPNKARRIAGTDVQNGADFAQVTAQATLEGRPVQWSVGSTKAGQSKSGSKSDLEDLNQAVRALWPEEQNCSHAAYPLAVFYDVKRAVVEIPLRVREVPETGPLAAYQNALDSGGADFKRFFSWFRNQEDWENENRVDDPSYRDPLLEPVRQAIEHFTGLSNLRVQRRPKRMTLQKGEEKLSVQQLSDGEQCYLALVGDLARRLALLNQDGEDPLQGSGLAIIDEVELHLHPGWQREIIPKLEATFPNCQFVLSTHSPQVLSHVRSEDVWILSQQEGEIVAEQPDLTYGVDSSLLLQSVLGVAERNPEVKRALDGLFSQIDEGNLDEARAQLSHLRATYGSLPQLARADAILTRKERVGR